MKLTHQLFCLLLNRLFCWHHEKNSLSCITTSYAKVADSRDFEISHVGFYFHENSVNIYEDWLDLEHCTQIYLVNLLCSNQLNVRQNFAKWATTEDRWCTMLWYGQSPKEHCIVDYQAFLETSSCFEFTICVLKVQM